MTRTEILRLAKICGADEQTVKRAIDNKRTTMPRVKSVLAKEGIHVDLITRGSWMPDRPICKTDNAFKAFAKNRALRTAK